MLFRCGDVIVLRGLTTLLFEASLTGLLQTPLRKLHGEQALTMDSPFQLTGPSHASPGTQMAWSKPILGERCLRRTDVTERVILNPEA